MKKSHRNITSLLMMAIYLLIVFSPLTPLAMQSKLVAHAVTGECSGDCRIDGCSLERSANHTCCCWQKKQHNAHVANLHSESAVCETPSPTKVSQKKSPCCEGDVHEAAENTSNLNVASAPPSQKSTTTTITSSPCGSGKLFSFLNIQETQHIPFCFSGEIPSPEQSILSFISPERLTSRHDDPPDPPPIISILS